jgi:hypothetical protein
VIEATQRIGYHMLITHVFFIFSTDNAQHRFSTSFVNEASIAAIVQLDISE